jgi:hypothetical protein
MLPAGFCPAFVAKKQAGVQERMRGTRIHDERHRHFLPPGFHEQVAPFGTERPELQGDLYFFYVRAPLHAAKLHLAQLPVQEKVSFG